MRRLSTLLLALMLSMILFACSDTPDPAEESEAPPPPPVQEVETISGDYPTQSDVDQYNLIMDALNSDLSKSEDEILAGFQGDMGMTTAEIKDYMNWVMPYAVGIEKLPGTTAADKPEFIELISHAETAIEDLLGEKVSVPVDHSSWGITETGNRYVMASDAVEIDGNRSNVIIKMEFDDNYTSFTVFQLKIDGVDIAL